MCRLYFDGGALLKSPGKIRNWGRWSDTVDVRLQEIDFVVWVRLQNLLSIRVDKEEILVGKFIWGDRKLEDTVSRKLLTSSDDWYLSRSILQVRISIHRNYLSKFLKFDYWLDI